MNVSKSGEGAVVPRFPSTPYSVVLGVTTVVLCIAGLCGVALCLMRFMTPYTEVLVSYWNLHVRRRLWAQDLQVVADVVESPSRSIMKKNQGWCSPSWEVSCPGWRGLQGNEWVYNEGSTSLTSCLTQRREQCTSGSSGCCRFFCLYNSTQKIWLSRVWPESVLMVVWLFDNNNNNFVHTWLSRIEPQSTVP